MSETLKPETSLSFSVIEVCVFGFGQEKKRKEKPHVTVFRIVDPREVTPNHWDLVYSCGGVNKEVTGQVHTCANLTSVAFELDCKRKR